MCTTEDINTEKRKNRTKKERDETKKKKGRKKDWMTQLLSIRHGSNEKNRSSEVTRDTQASEREQGRGGHSYRCPSIATNTGIHIHMLEL